MVEGMEEGRLCLQGLVHVAPASPLFHFLANKQYVSANWYKIHFYSLESIFSLVE